MLRGEKARWQHETGKFDGGRVIGTGSEKMVRGRKRMGMGCLGEWTLVGQLPGRGWLRTVAWSRTLSPTDESAGGEGEG